MPAQIELPGTEALVRRAPDPLTILQAAVDKNLNPETLKQLMDLQERYEANEAKKEFVEAMSLFKSNPPKIFKNKHVEFGNTKFDHPTLDHVCEQVIQALSAVGISHCWRPSQVDGKIRVTCVLTHKRGHSEETTLEGPPDTSGSKNSIQSVGSSVTYLERYTLLAATGLAAEGQDDDGKGAVMTEEDARVLQDWIDSIRQASSFAELDQKFREAYQSNADQKFRDAVIAAKDETRGKLRKAGAR